MKLDYLKKPKYIPLKYIQGSRGERGWEVSEDIIVTLSDGYELLIPKGFETDLRSSPRILWSMIQPYNDSLLAYLIHDRLYADKLGQMKHFSGLDPKGVVRPFIARKFADNEMYKWALALAPDSKLESYLSYLAVRLFGDSVYWGRKSVPI